MRFVKFICAFLCLEQVITALGPPCLFLSPSCHVGYVMPLWLGKISYLITALLLGAAFYVIHRRNPIGWKIGRGLFVVLWLQFVSSVLWAMIKLSFPLIPSIVFVVVASVGGFIFLRWWGQRNILRMEPQGD